MADRDSGMEERRGVVLKKEDVKLVHMEGVAFT